MTIEKALKLFNITTSAEAFPKLLHIFICSPKKNFQKTCLSFKIFTLFLLFIKAKEEEEERKAIEEAERLAAEARRAEEQRLQKAIEEAQKREEEERKKKVNK